MCERQIMQFFPSSFVVLNRSLSKNQLTSIPENLFEGLKELRTVFLNNNQLTNMPEGLFNDCEDISAIYLSVNPGLMAPDTFVWRGHVKLKILDADWSEEYKHEALQESKKPSVWRFALLILYLNGKGTHHPLMDYAAILSTTKPFLVG
eukprot:TRINITY_DN15140_c0_g1_i3.p1 TRINITY_DN15140_c0_g1~~TRINITY_DN15140_c0_g1_i3.p1  ORF type:complete len:149 (-),score=20.00 TRINITY_DN15140_c0_g1_i3:86-532(-)